MAEKLKITLNLTEPQYYAILSAIDHYGITLQDQGDFARANVLERGWEKLRDAWHEANERSRNR